MSKEPFLEPFKSQIWMTIDDSADPEVVHAKELEIEALQLTNDSLLETNRVLRERRVELEEKVEVLSMWVKFLAFILVTGLIVVICTVVMR